MTYFHEIITANEEFINSLRINAYLNPAILNLNSFKVNFLWYFLDCCLSRWTNKNQQLTSLLCAIYISLWQIFMQGLGVQFFKHMTYWVCLRKFRQTDNDWHKKIITLKFPGCSYHVYMKMPMKMSHEERYNNISCDIILVNDGKFMRIKTKMPNLLEYFFLILSFKIPT